MAAATAASSAATASAGVKQAGGGGTLVVETSFQLKTADPGRMFEPTGELIDHALYDTLLNFRGGNVKTPVPDLASSYTVSPDGKTYTFTLVKNAKFSNGDPVTATDVVFSLQRVVNLQGNPSFLLQGETISSPGPYTVVMTSATPNPALPFILPNPALGVIDSKVLSAHGGSAAADASKSDTAEAFLNTASQGSGPYILAGYSTTTQVVLTANPRYWRAAPHYSKIVIRNVQANVQKLDVLRGESQIAVDLSPDQASGVSGVTLHKGTSPNVFFLFVNQNPTVSPITSNKDFDQAVRYAIDYNGLVNLAGTGAVQTPGIVPSVFAGALPSSAEVHRNLARARAALARSGLKNPAVSLAYPSDVQVNGLNFGDLAARVQSNLKTIGINVTLAPASVATALQTYRGGTEQMGLWEWGPDYPDPSDYLVFLPGNLVGLRAGWVAGADPTLSALGTQAAATVAPSTRVTQYQAIQRSLNAGSPFMPLIQPAQILVTSTKVKNVQSNALWLVNLSELG